MGLIFSYKFVTFLWNKNWVLFFLTCHQQLAYNRTSLKIYFSFHLMTIVGPGTMIGTGIIAVNEGDHYPPRSYYHVREGKGLMSHNEYVILEFWKVWIKRRGIWFDLRDEKMILKSNGWIQLARWRARVCISLEIQSEERNHMELEQGHLI